MPKIAELTIEIKNEADDAVTSLKNLKRVLKDTTKIDLDFSNIKTGNLQNIYKYVSSLNRILDPLAQKASVIGSAFNAMGTQSAAAVQKVTSKAQQMTTVMAQMGETNGSAVAVSNFGNQAEKAGKQAEKASNEIARTGETAKKAGNGFSLANTKLGGFIKQFGRLMKLKAMRQVVMQVFQAIKAGADNLYEYSRALNSADSASFKISCHPQH